MIDAGDLVAALGLGMLLGGWFGYYKAAKETDEVWRLFEHQGLLLRELRLKYEPLSADERAGLESAQVEARERLALLQG